jgi:hypothetical protein
MKARTSFSEISICTRPVDFRMSIDGLSSVVTSERGKNVFNTAALFVFSNREQAARQFVQHSIPKQARIPLVRSIS